MNVTGTLNHREALGFWLNDHGLLGAGAEIGCGYGAFATVVLRTWKGSKYYMVDPWENLPTSEYREEHGSVDFEQCHRDCQGIAARDNRVEILRQRSVEAAPSIPQESLDWVYIDAAHDYEHVVEDLDAWYPKVKLGGLVGGHDFYTAKEPPHYCEVDRAVEHWMSRRNLCFTVTPCNSWWTIK